MGVKSMANFYILTNNPQACNKYAELAVFEDTSVAGIFLKVRDAVHKGAVLINHPLSSSIKPNESPYKSLILSNSKVVLDVDSLQIIEASKAVLDKLPVKKRKYSQQVLAWEIAKRLLPAVSSLQLPPGLPTGALAGVCGLALR